MIWLEITVVLSFLMSFSIGANDAANGLATSFGSNAATLTKLAIIGSIAEFIGAKYCSDNVAATLSYDIVPEIESLSDEKQKRMMFSVCLCSFLFIMTSCFFGVPISGTHTVIGALLGAGIQATGASSLAWNKLIKIVFSWFLSPTVACLIAFLIMLAVTRFAQNTKFMSFTKRLFWVQVIACSSLILVEIIMHNFQKGQE